jgi:putative DNA primase/helicase
MESIDPKVISVINGTSTSNEASLEGGGFRASAPLTPMDAIDLLEPLTPGDFPNAKLLRNGEYSIATTIANVAHLLSSYDILVCYDVIRKKLDIQIPNLMAPPENYANTALNHIISIANLNGMSTTQLPAFVETIGDRNQINSVADWIKSVPWDGKSRFSDFCDTLTAREDYPSGLKETLLARWLMSAVAAALMPRGFHARGVLTLLGPQGLGKTAWFRALIPNEVLREQVFKGDHLLDLTNKDTVITAVSHWIVELGELEGSLKHLARLKAFITADSDKVRRPYARGDSEYSRRTVFCASVNDDQFLVDDTGNSRWWTIPVIKINYEHTIDMQQLFAEFAFDFENSPQRWWLSDSEEKLLEQHNKNHRTPSVVRELIMSGMQWDLPEDKWVFMSAIEVLRQLGMRMPGNYKCKECTAILRELFGERRKRKGKDGWMVPLSTTSFIKVGAAAADDDLY